MAFDFEDQDVDEPRIDLENEIDDLQRLPGSAGGVEGRCPAEPRIPLIVVGTGLADDGYGLAPALGGQCVILHHVGQQGGELTGGAVDVQFGLGEFPVFLVFAPSGQAGVHDGPALCHLAGVGQEHTPVDGGPVVVGITLDVDVHHAAHLFIQTGHQVGGHDIVVHPLLDIAAGHLVAHFFQDAQSGFQLSARDVGLAQVDQGVVEVGLHLYRDPEFRFGLLVTAQHHQDLTEGIVGVGQVGSEEGVFLHVLDGLLVVATVQFHVTEIVVAAGVVGIDFQDPLPDLFGLVGVVGPRGVAGLGFKHVDVVGYLGFQAGQDGVAYGTEFRTAHPAEPQLGQHAPPVVLDHRSQAVGAGHLGLGFLFFTQPAEGVNPGNGSFGQSGVQFEALSEFVDGGLPTEGVQIRGAFLT